MNLFNQGISTYNNWNFNSICYFNGNYYGATDTDIYQLGGDKDNGSDIDVQIQSGSMDFGDTFMKYLKEFWVTHRTGGKLRLRIWKDEDTSLTIDKQTVIEDTKIQEERVKMPAGLKGRFYTFLLKNIAGADFDIDNMSMLVESIKRKIR